MDDKLVFKMWTDQGDVIRDLTSGLAGMTKGVEGLTARIEAQSQVLERIAAIGEAHIERATRQETATAAAVAAAEATAEIQVQHAEKQAWKKRAWTMFENAASALWAPVKTPYGLLVALAFGYVSGSCLTKAPASVVLDAAKAAPLNAEGKD